MNIDRIAVMIPCYNEAATIGKVVQDFRRVLPDSVIYVYDNNSSDDTAKIAAENGAVVRHEYLRGKGNVMRRMFREIDAECYIITDGDDTYPVENAPEMARLVLENNADMVIGDRLSSTYFTENKRLFHNFGNSLVRFSINFLFKSDIRDIMTGYRAFSYKFIKTFPVLSRSFEIETEMTIHAIHNNLQIENVVIGYRDRPEGSVSKLNTYSDGIKVLRTIIKLFAAYHPGSFYGLMGAVLALLSIAFFCPILVTYIRTGLVPNFPTLIVCGFVLLTAIVSVFVGILLHTMLHKNRQDFEMELIHAENMMQRKLEIKDRQAQQG